MHADTCPSCNSNSGYLRENKAGLRRIAGPNRDVEGILWSVNEPEACMVSDVAKMSKKRYSPNVLAPDEGYKCIRDIRTSATDWAALLTMRDLQASKKYARKKQFHPTSYRCRASKSPLH